MGGGVSKTNFKFSFGKEPSGAIVFKVDEINGDSQISYIQQTVSTVKFVWNTIDHEYEDCIISKFDFNPSTARLSEYTRLTSNFSPKVLACNNKYVEIGLQTTENIPSVTWYQMLSLANAGIYLNCTVSVASVKKSDKVMSVNPFRYTTLMSYAGIMNNGVYVNQSGNSVYFDNPDVIVPIVFNTYECDTSNGQYLIDINVSEDGVIDYTNTYMPFVTGCRLIGDDLLITTSNPVTDYTGVIMSNINASSNHVINIGLLTTVTGEGILCSNIAGSIKGTNFTLMMIVN